VTTNKDLKVDYVQANFGKMATMSEYKTQIADMIKERGIDVGVLCLNAGLG